MTTATVTRRLQAEGLPVELVRGNGYHYWTFDDGDAFETESEMVYRFRDMPESKWLERGRDFAARAAAKIAERKELHDGSAYKLATKPAAEPVQPVTERMDRYRAAYKALHGRTILVVWTGEKVRVHTPGENPAYDVLLDADALDEISARMEAKVRQPVRVDEGLDDIFAEVEAKARAEAEADKAKDDAAFAALSAEERAALVEARAAKVEGLFDIADDEEPDDDEEEGDVDADEEESR
jgi:hypothetical protein